MENITDFFWKNNIDHHLNKNKRRIKQWWKESDIKMEITKKRRNYWITVMQN